MDLEEGHVAAIRHALDQAPAGATMIEVDALLPGLRQVLQRAPEMDFLRLVAAGIADQDGWWWVRRAWQLGASPIAPVGPWPRDPERFWVLQGYPPPYVEALLAVVAGAVQGERRRVALSDISFDPAPRAILRGPGESDAEAFASLVAREASRWADRRRRLDESGQETLLLRRPDGSLWAHDATTFVAAGQQIDPAARIACRIVDEPGGA